MSFPQKHLGTARGALFNLIHLSRDEAYKIPPRGFKKLG